MHGLRFQAEQMHFNALQWRVVKSAVRKLAEIKVAAQFTVGARQQVQIERSRHSLRVVVGRVQNIRRLDQVHTEQQCTACQMLRAVLKK